eukprot:CAMPEP_0175079680 /NCGR_PEP_ID=MMETSP0052_2-20121109/24972_1 /TAXON_ID=51329 ORGANISM="Polytomella parva, Strain SAG 63-3" /NCGR_SAMPLE_ID=MMETSP0052_2 /ASSEMBLY_ACC=CAM_ASM_000194 /LENGTH=75 /DNA_ID=CAMNT_0016350067 /DNA_START=320 /DNA_END=547 /DNA_ORIENTATION=-
MSDDFSEKIPSPRSATTLEAVLSAFKDVPDIDQFDENEEALKPYVPINAPPFNFTANDAKNLIEIIGSVDEEISD